MLRAAYAARLKAKRTWHRSRRCQVHTRGGVESAGHTMWPGCRGSSGSLVGARYRTSWVSFRARRGSGYRGLGVCNATRVSPRPLLFISLFRHVCTMGNEIRRKTNSQFARIALQMYGYPKITVQSATRRLFATLTGTARRNSSSSANGSLVSCWLLQEGKEAPIRLRPERFEPRHARSARRNP